MADKGAKPPTLNVIMTPITEGVIMDSVVSNYVAPEGCLSFAENVHNDVIGVMTSRPPFIRLSNFSGGVSNPMSVFVVNNLVNQDKALVYWQEGRDLKQTQLITTTSITTSSNFFGSATRKNRWDVIQNTLLFTNFAGSSAVYYQQGGNILTSVPTALDTEFPNSVDLISAGFVGRVWGAGSTNTTTNLYYSDVIPAAGITSLTTASQQYLRINANNGDYITGLIRTQQVLFVFTNNGVFRVFGTTSLDNSPVSTVGAPSQEAIVKTKNGIYFYHYSGIYKLNNDGTSQEISRKIYPLIRRVPPANQKSVFSWFDDDHIYFYLGTLTGYDTNKYYIVRYTLSTQVWTTYSTRTPLLAGFSTFLTDYGATETASTQTWYPLALIMTADNAATFGVGVPGTEGESYYGDFKSSGNPEANIYIETVSHWMNFGSDSTYKRINGLALAGEYAAGFNLQYQVDNDQKDTWRNVGNITESFSTLFRDFNSVEFNRIRFRVTGITQGGLVKISPLVVLGLDDLGFKHG